MNRLARLAALARVAGNNLPSALAAESQVRGFGTRYNRDYQGLGVMGLFGRVTGVCSKWV